MNQLQDMKTKLSGKHLPVLVAVLGVVASFAAGFFTYPNLIKNQDMITLSREEWMCTVTLVDTKKETFECVVYGKLGRNLEKYPNPRHREHNKEQGPSVHTFQ